MQIDRHAERALGFGDARHVIDVRVRQQDVRDLQLLRANEVQQLLDLVARIDEHGLAGALAADDVAILEERPDGRAFQDH